MIRKKIFKELITKDEIESLSWLPCMEIHNLTLKQLSVKLSVRTSILKRKLKEYNFSCLDFPRIKK